MSNLFDKPDTQKNVPVETLSVYFAEMSRIIEEVCPSSRERSLAITNLEQSYMWAVGSIRLNTEP